MNRSGMALIAVALTAVPASTWQDPPAVPARTSVPVRQPLSPRQEAELRADTFMVRKRYAEAVEAYKEILKKEPKNATLLNKTGIAYHHLNNFGQARRYYERAIKADRTYANALNNLGTVYYQRKNYRKAITYYRRALELRPELAATHSNLGHAYFAQKKYDEALQAFRAALQLDPLLFERRSATGSLLQQGIGEERALFFFFLAKSYATMGNAERTAHYLRKALDEGYKKLSAVEQDPAFASVVKDPLVQQVLHPETAVAAPPGL